MRELTHSEKVSKSLIGKTEEKSRRWKGDNAGYVAIHIWLKKKLGKACKCENPNCVYPKKIKYRKPIIKPRRYEWANISRENKRDINDWIQLCPSCHRTYDINKLTLKELYEQTNKIQSLG